MVVGIAKLAHVYEIENAGIDAKRRSKMVKKWRGVRLDEISDDTLIEAMAETLKVYRAILLEISQRGLNKRVFAPEGKRRAQP
jgi:L-serine deaminase